MNIFEQAKQAMQMRKEAKRIQSEIERISVSYANGGIEATMKGDFTLTGLVISPEALEEVKAGKTDRFATMLQSVFNGALKKAKEATQEHMQRMMKDSGLGGMFG